MKRLLVLLLAFFGDFAIIAGVPKVTAQSSSNNGLTSLMERESQLVRNLKTDLKDTNLMQQLTMKARKFGDYSQSYSPSVTPMLSELRSLITNGEDNLFDAVQPVHGWCVSTKDLLEAYTSLFDQSNDESIDAQNQLIQSIFNEDIITPVSNELNKLSNNLNRASATLSSIFAQFDADFSEESQFFQSEVRAEFLKEKNKNFAPELIQSISTSMARESAKIALATSFGNPQVPNPITATTFGNPQVLNPIGATYFGNPQVPNPMAVLPLGNLQQQYRPAVLPTLTQAPSTINLKEYRPYQNRVSFRFGRTRGFFKNFELHLNEMILHTNEVKSKLAQNNQFERTAKVTENTAMMQTNAAQVNELKYAAHTLMKQCTIFNATPLKN